MNNEKHNSNRFNFDSMQQNQAQSNLDQKEEEDEEEQQQTCSNLHDCNISQKDNTKPNNNNYINNISKINIRTVNNYVNRKNQASSSYSSSTKRTSDCDFTFLSSESDLIVFISFLNILKRVSPLVRASSELSL